MDLANFWINGSNSVSDRQTTSDNRNVGFSNSSQWWREGSGTVESWEPSISGGCMLVDDSDSKGSSSSSSSSIRCGSPLSDTSLTVECVSSEGYESGHSRGLETHELFFQRNDCKGSPSSAADRFGPLAARGVTIDEKIRDPIVFQNLLQKIAENALLVGRRINYVSFDRNSLFKAISQEMYGTENEHRSIRLLAASHLKVYWRYYLPYFKGSATKLRKYSMILRKNNTAPPSFILIVLATALRRTIFIYKLVCGMFHWLRVNSLFHVDDNCKFITLSSFNYNSTEYYQQLVPIYADSLATFIPPFVQAYPE